MANNKQTKEQAKPHYMFDMHVATEIASLLITVSSDRRLAVLNTVECLFGFHGQLYASDSSPQSASSERKDD